jgi:hypothetical protein
MNMDQNELNELQSLCEAVVEGNLTAEAQQRLEQLVLGSAEARRFYAAYLHQHAALQWSAADPTFLPVASSPAAETTSPASTFSRIPSRLASIVRERWPWIAGMTIAAALLIAAWPQKPVEVARQPQAPVEDQVKEPLDFTVAVLVSAPGVEWADASVTPRTGAPLPPGWLRVKSGFAQLEFYSGATVILEGPAELELLSRMEAYCARGKLRVTVPPHAHGFAIRTPKLELVDLGTEFGVQVDERQGTMVQVFQ